MTFEPEEVITDLSRLRELMPEFETSNAKVKATDRLNDVARRFIEMAPFLVLATHESGGLMDISPKGDPAGFVEIYDDKTLLIPDRLGNHRIDGFRNVLTDPNVALIFMIPNHGDTLRISGKARIIRDSALNARLAVNGREPLLALAVEVEEVFMHCSKALIRSRLWQPDHWPEKRTAPTLAEWVIAAVDRDQTLEAVQEDHSQDEVTRLY